MDAPAQLNTALAGRYTIEREIGRGGMATVYLARDVRHNRQVALKVLNPELGAVLGVERFLAEIRVTANLQHPNLLPLFDSGDAEGLLFYVMPFVAGESLRARLAREKQLPVDEALRIATAVASALDYAHRHGVIHRDLKPENILLHEGQPMVADFGIALAVSNAGGDRITQTGLSLGTPHYMSPEQATGDRTIDGRTDVYSLGAVTYETLTGEPPHIGNTSQAVIARVLTDQVRPIRSTRPAVPEFIDAAILRALEKLPADRWATANELATALTSPSAVTASSTYTAQRAGRKARNAWSLVPWGIAAVATAVAIAALLRPQPRTPTSRFHIALPDSVTLAAAGWASSLALSPDGTKLAFIGGRNTIHVRPLDDLATRMLAGTEGSLCPTFSPDGQWIVYSNEQSQLRRIPFAGGSSLDVGATSRCGIWTERNEIIAMVGAQVVRVNVDGGQRTRITEGDSIAIEGGQALPGGKAILVTIVSRTSAGTVKPATLTIDDGRLIELGVEGSTPRYADGRLFYVRRDGNLMVAPFSLSSYKLTGTPVPIAQNVIISKFGISNVAVTGNGTLAYFAGDQAEARMYAVDTKGKERPIGGSTGLGGWPRVSPDGRRIALEIGTSILRWDIWVYDIASDALTKLTTNGFSLRSLTWTSDSRSVVYILPDSTGFAAPRRLVSQVWNGSQEPKELLHFTRPIESASVSSGYLAFALGPLSTIDVWIAHLDSLKAARPLIATNARELHPSVSSDGKYLAYASNESGRFQVYVRPLHGAPSRLQVSTTSGSEPVWDRPGRNLFYRGPSHMMRARLGGEGELEVISRDTLFEDIYTRDAMGQVYDVMPGGRELLMMRNDSRQRLAVVLNWPELLRTPR